MSEKLEKLETLLFKHRLNTKSLSELLPSFSDTTINSILKDLEIYVNSKIEEQAKQIINIFTDGGCSNNGRKGARAAYAVHFPDFSHLDTSKNLHENPTNQHAELSGILTATQIILNNTELFQNKAITIYTDSMYSIKCITLWSKNWVRNGWLGANGKPVKNSECISNILENLKKLANLKIEIEFEHVFSHTTEPKGISKDSLKYKIWLGNKIVDEMVQTKLMFKYN